MPFNGPGLSIYKVFQLAQHREHRLPSNAGAYAYLAHPESAPVACCQTPLPVRFI
ncbi:MAG: hypothetical protein MUC60_15695 [Oscillatoria sp. Prado101]|nr:hypothetical protein [Oscillatoria sp. Prado101]